MPLIPSQFPRTDLATKTAASTVQVVLAYRRSALDWAFTRLPLHGDLQTEFLSRVITATEDLRDNRVGRAYDPEWELQPNEFFYLPNDPPTGGNFFPQLPGFATMREFAQPRRARPPNAWIVIAQLPDQTLAYYGARISPSAILNRSSIALRIVYHDNAFDKLDDTVITFNPGFDWIAWQDVLIVLNAKNFHAMFRDIPALVAKVDAYVAEIVQHIGIDNLAAFADRIKSDPRMVVKLQHIIDRADMHTKPPHILRQYAIDYAIDVDWDGDLMVFDSSIEKQWNILRLLDEARTLGPVTGKHWDSSSKVEA